MMEYVSYLQTATTKDAFVQYDGVAHEVWLCELNVCISVTDVLADLPQSSFLDQEQISRLMQ